MTTYASTYTRNNSSLSGHAQQRMPVITVQDRITFGLVISLKCDSLIQVLFVIEGLQQVVGSMTPKNTVCGLSISRVIKK